MVDVLQVVLAYVAADVLQVAHITVLAHVEDAEEDVGIAIKMMSSNYYMIQIADHNNSWQEGSSKEITFIVTKDCQLACKYCYLVGKNSQGRMSFDIAQKAVDYILSHEFHWYFNQKSVIWDFIGGEPFLEIELIDKICDYIKKEMYRLNHHWFDSYRFSFSTNGLTYSSDKVQKFIDKNKKHLSIGITIDGTQRKHDLNRIYKSDGRGSYRDVVKNIPLWLEQFPNEGTKVTISSADIPYITESVLHLFSLGIHQININCVFENVWNSGDDKLFEDQLIELADNMIDRELYKTNSCSFFDEGIGKPLDRNINNENWCGAGKMLSVDADGYFYPCTRFAQYSLRDKKAWILGNVYNGIDENKLRPFFLLNRTSQSPMKCIECEVASGCSWCQAENFDSADTYTLYQRSTAICLMHQARVRANNYYWNKLYRTIELKELKR